MPTDKSPDVTDEVYGKEESIARILSDLGRTAHPKLLSDVDEEEIPLLVALGILGKRIKSDLVNDSIEDFLNLRVSLNRQGRQEMITVALASRYRSGSGKSKSGLKSLLSGLR